MIVEFEVIGVPRPQGSKAAFLVKGKAGPRAGMRDMGGKAGTEWRDAVASAAKDMAGKVGKLDGPLALSVSFRFPMPASRPKKVRMLSWWWKTTAPDTSKILRSLEDGLTAGGLIADDARICLYENIEKIEVHDWTGAVVQIKELDAGGTDTQELT